MDMRDPLEKAVDRAAVARRVRNAETTILEQHYEIERLTRELEVQRDSQISAVNGMLKAEQDCERLTRERDEARAALKTIADHSSTESDFPHCVEGLQNYARRALEQTAPTPEKPLLSEDGKWYCKRCDEYFTPSIGTRDYRCPDCKR